MASTGPFPSRRGRVSLLTKRTLSLHLEFRPPPIGGGTVTAGGSPNAPAWLRWPASTQQGWRGPRWGGRWAQRLRRAGLCFSSCDRKPGGTQSRAGARCHGVNVPSSLSLLAPLSLVCGFLSGLRRYNSHIPGRKKGKVESQKAFASCVHPIC